MRIRTSNQSLFYNFDYESVIQFVLKNTVIINTMQTFTEARKNSDSFLHIEQLYHAVTTSDLANNIFSDPNCQLYSLYLLKNKKISIDDFLTINIYLMALMQFTKKQLLKEHTSKQLTRAFTICSLSDDILQAFVNKAIDMCNKGHFPQQSVFFKDQFKNNVANLPSLGRVVMAVPCEIDIDSFIYGASQVAPFILKDEKNNCYYIPSAHFINAMLSGLNPEQPVKMAPIFGSVGFATEAEMHKLGVHPIALYSPFVKSNPLTVHGKTPGPLPVLIHDFFHVCIGNHILTKNRYKFLYDYLLPNMMNEYKLTYNDIEAIANNSYQQPIPDFNKAYLYALYNIIDINIHNCNKQLDWMLQTVFLNETYDSTLNTDLDSENFKHSLKLLLDFRKDAEEIKKIFAFSEQEFAPIINKINEILLEYKSKVEQWFSPSANYFSLFNHQKNNVSSYKCNDTLTKGISL